MVTVPGCAANVMVRVVPAVSVPASSASWTNWIVATGTGVGDGLGDAGADGEGAADDEGADDGPDEAGGIEAASPPFPRRASSRAGSRGGRRR